MSTYYSFQLTVFGTPSELDSVREFIKERVTTKDGDALYINGADLVWFKPKVGGSSLDSFFAVAESGSELHLHGEAKDRPALYVADEISRHFPTLRVQVGGSSEEGRYERWEFSNGESVLLELSDQIVFGELGFGTTIWEMKDGVKVLPEERRDWVLQEFEQLDVFKAEELGVVFSEDEKKRRRCIVESAIEEHEEWLCKSDS